MITYVRGNLFESSAQVLTNAVNCVGIMGKGIALEFKKRYPAMFCKYVARCTAGQMKIGEPCLWEDDEVQILNFPTKRHWQTPSSLEDIEAGLRWLALNYGELGFIRLLCLPLDAEMVDCLGTKCSLSWKSILVRFPISKFLSTPTELERLLQSQATIISQGKRLENSIGLLRQPQSKHCSVNSAPIK